MAIMGGCGPLQVGSYFPEFREKRALERGLQIPDAGGAAGTGLVTDDAFDRFHVAKSPLLEPIFDIDQFLGKFIEIKMLLRLAIDRKPDVAHPWVRVVGLGKIAIEHLLWHRMAAAGEK